MPRLGSISVDPAPYASSMCLASISLTWSCLFIVIPPLEQESAWLRVKAELQVGFWQRRLRFVGLVFNQRHIASLKGFFTRALSLIS